MASNGLGTVDLLAVEVPRDSILPIPKGNNSKKEISGCKAKEVTRGAL
jgi:hypothetical protein